MSPRRASPILLDRLDARSPWLLPGLAGRADDAYEEYATALRCKDTFDRAFCHERRAALEAQHGWLRNALHSLEEALAADRRASSARVAAYEATIANLEPHVPRERARVPASTELPSGFGAKNELGEPLTDDVIEIERLRVPSGGAMS